MSSGNPWLFFHEADGGADTLDGDGFFDAYDVSSGDQLLHRAMTRTPARRWPRAISSGVAVAGHTAYVAAADASSGWIVAYRR